MKEEAEIWRLATQGELALREPPEFQGPSTSEADLNLVSFFPSEGGNYCLGEPEEGESLRIHL